MAEGTKSGSEAELAKFSGDISSIKARVFWLMVPTFFILVAVLGLSILTWIEVNAITNKVRSVEQSIDALNKHMKPTQPPTLPAETEKDKEKTKGTTSVRINAVPFANRCQRENGLVPAANLGDRHFAA